MKNSQKSLTKTHYLLIAFSFSCMAVLHAEDKDIYEQINDEGVIEFTDIPNKKNRPVHLPKMNTYKQKKLPPITRNPTPPKEEVETYEELIVTSPLHDSHIRQTTGKIVVTINVEPALKRGHSILITIDNDPTLSATGSLTHYTFEKILRGTHTLQVSVIDKEGEKLFEAKESTFHLHRYINVLPTTTPATK